VSGKECLEQRGSGARLGNNKNEVLVIQN